MYAQFKFEMADNFDYDAFFGDSTKVSAFKDAFVAQLAGTLQIAASAIQVRDVRKGSIVADITIDTVGLNTNQLQTIVGTIQNSAPSLFTADFLTVWGIKSVSAKLTDAPGQATNSIPAIVGGVVGGVGGALLIGGVTWYIIRKRRAAGVEPRANRAGLLAEDQDV